MKPIIFGIVCGVLLSWVALEGLRRSARRILDSAGKGGRTWGWLFVFRYGTLALAFWFFLEFFKGNIAPFVLSFIVSHILLRHWYRRKTYA